MERNISLSCVVAAALWTGAVILTLSGSISAIGPHAWALAMILFAHAFLAMGAAATLTVRNLFERQNRLLQHAYRLGRDHPASVVSRIGAG